MAGTAFFVGIFVFLLVVVFGVFIFWSLASEEGKKNYHTRRLKENPEKDTVDTVEYLKDGLKKEEKDALQLDSWVAATEKYNKTRRN